MYGITLQDYMIILYKIVEPKDQLNHAWTPDSQKERK